MRPFALIAAAKANRGKLRVGQPGEVKPLVDAKTLCVLAVASPQRHSEPQR